MQRRSFLTTSGAALGFFGLQKHLTAAEPSRVISPYGALVADPEGVLDLPQGFAYQIISRRGLEMDDGLKVPGMPDGMACFEGKGHEVILVRNHELGVASQNMSPFPNNTVPRSFDKAKSYDHGERGEAPHIGGTSTVVYDIEKKVVVTEFLSLVGTDRNCAGGAMPWGSWITCEEPGDLTSERGQRHGYCFEVKASDDGKLQKAIPLKKLGRFRHEAVAADPNTDIIYLTEDMNDGLLYRFIPKTKGNLHEGQLQALVIEGKPSADLRNYRGGRDTIAEGVEMPVSWIDVDDYEAPANDLRYQGFKEGAARFARGEGIQFTEGSFYICCTDGGPNRQGQIYCLTPGKTETLSLFLQPTSNDLLTNGDNLCAAPWGDLIICEDLVAEHKNNIPHLRGITPDGKIYSLARNAKSTSEFAGSCFSPDGSILFVNMQGDGLTLAITG
ncbi:MAG: secreted PhoX family phosphatase, partial [Akkermansiaceae bacterium]